MKHSLLALAATAIAAANAAKQPNIVMILTDDQDVEMGSLDYMPKLKTYLADQGATFNRMYAAVPVCCPSRSALYSGQFQHNNHVWANSIGENCSSVAWQQGPESHSFATYLAQAGYVTSFAGKYLNCYGSPAVGGVAHIPPGWTNWQGLVGNSIYYGYTLSNNGVAEHHANSYAQDYLPDLVLNKTLSFLDQHAGQGMPPFFAMMSPPSCHGPQEAAPQYQELYPSAAAPRTPSFNATVKDTHWLQEVKAEYGLDDNSAQFVDLVYRRRVQTLASVDDMIESVVNKLSDMGVLDNTYIMYSTDNGYHTGQFGFIYDKRQPWETDVHLPLFVRGPNVPANSSTDAIVTMPDLSATFLDIAGVTLPSQFDGASVLPYAEAATVNGDGERSITKKTATASTGRLMTLVEYHGETSDGGDGPACALTHGSTLFCNADGNYTLPPFFYGQPLCVCQDAANNTYNCLRLHNDTQNWRYCEFADSQDTVEYFDYIQDPFELTNLAPSMDSHFKDVLHSRLAEAVGCSGSTQCSQILTDPILL